MNPPHELKFVCSTKKSRLLVIIDGHNLWLPFTTFKMLFTLAWYKYHLIDNGWVQRELITGASNQARYLYKLRADITNELVAVFDNYADNKLLAETKEYRRLILKWRVVENDRNCSYRLFTHPECQFEFNNTALKELNDYQINELLTMDINRS